MTPVIRCGGCPKTWTARNAAHCCACHETFAGVTLFDAHRTTDGPFGGCLPPRSLTDREGRPRLRLVDGVWRGPEASPELRARWAALGARGEADE
jgi:hypothetical protein